MQDEREPEPEPEPESEPEPEPHAREATETGGQSEAADGVLEAVAETLWEGGRWWVGAGWKLDKSGFQAEEVCGPSKDGLAKAMAAALVSRDSGEVAVGGAAEGGDDEGGLGAARRLLRAANARAERDRPCCTATWLWERAGWRVVADGSTDPQGWTYGTDWPRLTQPREGGRASQRTTDMVRRRRLTRNRLLVDLSAGAAPPAACERLGQEKAPAEAVAALELELATTDEARAEVSEVVRELFRAHVLSRSLADIPLDPSAVYRVASKHKTEMHQAWERGRPVAAEPGGADAELLRELGIGMRFANAAYGYAQGMMRTVSSNVRMHANRCAARPPSHSRHKKVLGRQTNVDAWFPWRAAV